MSQGFSTRQYNEGSGIVLQVVNSQDGEVATGTTKLSQDDTIPQITEGDEFMSASITPTNSANLALVISLYSLASLIISPSVMSMLQVYHAFGSM